MIKLQPQDYLMICCVAYLMYAASLWFGLALPWWGAVRWADRYFTDDE